MAVYSIRDLEKLTGIKAHTIRIWEQRYGLITPARTETNIRYYTDENLRLLFYIALLNKNGVKISKLARLKPEEIAAQGAALSNDDPGISNRIEAVTLSMIDLDEAAFEDVFSAEIREGGFEMAMIKLIYPFLEKLRILWLTSGINPSQEKFMIQLIRRKLMAAIDNLPSPESKTGHAKFLLYSPEGESQELALLFLDYLVRVRQLESVYFGAGVSLPELRDACQLVQPDYVLTILQDPIPNLSVQAYVDGAAQCTGASELLLSGAQMFISPVQLPTRARVLNGLEETRQFLDVVRMKRK